MARKEHSRLSSPASTGGAGAYFEAHIHALFITMMLTGGRVPYFPGYSIVKIEQQQKISGYQTDDLIVTMRRDDTEEERKLLVSVKRSIDITQSSRGFADVIRAAWTDFNNSAKFRQDKDQIFLVTGPLSKTDTQDVRWLLTQARVQQQPEKFFRNALQEHYSSSAKTRKLKAFQYHLQNANGGDPVPEDETLLFLRHFYILGYDLGEDDGGALQLILSLIAQSSEQAPKLVWSRIVDFAQSLNQHSGIITLQDIPEDIMELFGRKAIPPPLGLLVSACVGSPELDWNNREKAELALMNLVGAWDGQNDADISAIRGIIGASQNSEWQSKTEGMLNLSGSPLRLQAGQFWSVTNRSKLWDMLASHIFNHHLDAYENIAIEVLTKHDPAFDLPAENRYAASIHGKVPKYSPTLQRGLADGLAMLGNKPDAKHPSTGKAKNTAASAVHKILSIADWKLWGSLNHVLPALAEAAPDQFLEMMENALLQSPCPYDALFEQEDAGPFGDNYLTGLLWALEGLAWDENYLISACVILARLAERDPGGNWANRPGASLSTILLPWAPQTLAPFKKQKVAVQTVCRECPEIGWNLVTSLLPNQLAVSSGSHRPVWRDAIPEDWPPAIKKRDYWKQVDIYAGLAIDLAGQNPEKLAELLDHMKTLTKPFQKRLLAILSSDDIIHLPDDRKRMIWDKLVFFVTLNRQFPDAKWSLDSHSLTRIEAVAKNLKPSDPMEHSRHLFSSRDIDLYETVTGDLEEQARRLQERRQKAVSEILELDGTADVRRVIRFAGTVENPDKVGFALGHISNKEIDAAVLPECLISSDHKLSAFASGYVRSRHHITKGWAWADGLDRSAWTPEQAGQFLCYLPFTQETWTRTSNWLDDRQSEFWSRTDAIPYHEEGKMDAAVEKLLEHDRPHAAIGCLDRMRTDEMPIDTSQCIRALLSAVKSAESRDAIEPYHIVELIKFLQGDSDIPTKDLCEVEWAYLQLLEEYDSKAHPKALESQLAKDPNFFCEIIQHIYRPKGDDLTAHKPTKSEQRIASNARLLLHQWKTVPGAQANGDFDDEWFVQWLQDVKKMCTETGHLEVALAQVGKVLIHCPTDPSGLWIRRSIADALNDRAVHDLRDGYSAGWYNSRGVHHVDPTGKPELKLAEEFRERASAVENEGFQRLAATLRELANGYAQEADSVVARYTDNDS